MSLNILRLPGGDASWRRTLVALQQRLPLLTSIALVLGIAWLLAGLTWSLLPAPRMATPIYNGNTGPAPQAFNIDKLVDQHLFGITGKQANTGNAPETTLALTLSGIAADPNQSKARAIITAGDDQKTYAVGAQLPGGAVIKQILADEVLLELKGHVESLRLPKASSGDQGSTGNQFASPDDRPAPMSQRISQTPATPPASNLGQLRTQIMKNPERLMDVIRPMPVMENGKFSGYRVYPAGNPRLFEQLGLKPGDIVTAVNGISLDNPANGMQILRKIKTSDQVSVTLTRNGQQQTEVLQMQDNSK